MLGANDVDEGTPERLYHPWEIEKAREESHRAVADAHFREHRD